MNKLKKIQKDTLFHGEHSKFANQILNRLFIQGFGEEISELLGGRNIEKFNFALLRDVTDEVMPSFNVLCFCVLNWMLGYEDGTSVITANWSLSEFVAIIEKLIFDPQHLSTAATIGYIFSLSG